ncbi:MAG: hypothetical protein M3530_01075 [Thermoproteota archaeon]|nr:hypothetical protein [Thermoproteota archaeon]
MWRLENFDEIKTRAELVHCGFVAEENEMYVEHTGGMVPFSWQTGYVLQIKNEIITACNRKDLDTCKSVLRIQITRLGIVVLYDRCEVY